jgi:integrase/recombinase XerD
LRTFETGTTHTRVQPDIKRSKQDSCIRVKFPYHAKLIAQVKRILEALPNRKCREMLSHICACRLRRSELPKLQLSRIQSDKGLLLVRQAKRKKDKVLPLSAKLSEGLRRCYLPYRPKCYLFDGQDGGRNSEKSIQRLFNQAIANAGIAKPAAMCWLRHSYATHLLEHVTDLHYIKELLGHNSSCTAEFHTHRSQHNLQQIRSPFSDL